jgi:hypothetical protein
MAHIDQLLVSFKTHVGFPLKQGLPLSQRSWFVVYPPEEERRLSPRLPEFEIATRDAGLGWQRMDLSGAFAEWLDTFDPDERRATLENPAILESYSETGFIPFLKARIDEAVTNVPPDHQTRTVFALTGLIELFDFVHVSDLIESLDKSFPGVLLVFFPGEREANTYRFLCARDGWNYLAVHIVAES